MLLILFEENPKESIGMKMVPRNINVKQILGYKINEHTK